MLTYFLLRFCSNFFERTLQEIIINHQSQIGYLIKLNTYYLIISLTIKVVR